MNDEEDALVQDIENDLEALSEKMSGSLAMEFLMRIYQLVNNELIDRVIEEMTAERHRK